MPRVNWDCKRVLVPGTIITPIPPLELHFIYVTYIVPGFPLPFIASPIAQKIPSVVGWVGGMDFPKDGLVTDILSFICSFWKVRVTPALGSTK